MIAPHRARLPRKGKENKTRHTIISAYIRKKCPFMAVHDMLNG
jgi:hypothetical protein